MRHPGLLAQAQVKRNLVAALIFLIREHWLELPSHTSLALYRHPRHRWMSDSRTAEQVSYFGTCQSWGSSLTMHPAPTYKKVRTFPLAVGFKFLPFQVLWLKEDPQHILLRLLKIST